MKNRIRFKAIWKIAGIAAIAAVIGFALALSAAGCDSGGGGGLPPLKGTVIISGHLSVGQTLTANTEPLGGSGGITYQWKSGGA
ncbi:MAG: hypothetical protein LBH43_00850, partial [Treponema sp.]|nr:hypothetical protein [Treponema sp.]